MKPALTIGTPCTRRQNLPAISAALEPALDLFDLRWCVVLDTPRTEAPMPDAPYPVKCILEDSRAPAKWTHRLGNRHLNQVIATVQPNGWFWVLDDDNIPLPGFFPRLAFVLASVPGARAVVFRQDILPGKCRRAAPGHIGPRLSDGTQVVARGDVLGPVLDERASDGSWGLRIVEAAGDDVVWVDEPGLLGYNLLRPGKGLGW